MLPRWIILGLMLAGIVFGTIIWWPEQPMWKTRLSRSAQIVAFSRDNKTLFIFDERRNDINEPINPLLSKLDVLTGKVLTESPVKLPDSFEPAPFGCEISGDEASLVFPGRLDQDTDIARDLFFVFDTPSGQKRL